MTHLSFVFLARIWVNEPTKEPSLWDKMVPQCFSQQIWRDASVTSHHILQNSSDNSYQKWFWTLSVPWDPKSLGDFSYRLKITVWIPDLLWKRSYNFKVLICQANTSAEVKKVKIARKKFLHSKHFTHTKSWGFITLHSHYKVNSHITKSWGFNHAGFFLLTRCLLLPTPCLGCICILSNEGEPLQSYSCFRITRNSKLFPGNQFLS